MAEETQFLIKKITNLQDLWMNISKDDESNKFIRKINSLHSRSINMVESLKNEGSLNAGGKFEWVDSILIKVSIV